VHKTELGAVRIDLRDEEGLKDALDAMDVRLAHAGLRAESYLLQEMASGGHEVIFGVSTDARFGPLLMFGLGGKYVEVFEDVRFGVPPLSREEASDMVHGIRGARLLHGVRGEAAAWDDEAAPVEALTPRELDVLRLLADGAVNRAIGERLGISDHTVKFHLSAIFGKLGVTTRTAAVRRALRLGWIDA